MHGVMGFGAPRANGNVHEAFATFVVRQPSIEVKRRLYQIVGRVLRIFATYTHPTRPTPLTPIPAHTWPVPSTFVVEQPSIEVKPFGPKVGRASSPKMFKKLL